jgi:hypothetical protein
MGTEGVGFEPTGLLARLCHPFNEAVYLGKRHIRH